MASKSLGFHIISGLIIGFFCFLAFGSSMGSSPKPTASSVVSEQEIAEQRRAEEAERQRIASAQDYRIGEDGKFYQILRWGRTSASAYEVEVEKRGDVKVDDESGSEDWQWTQVLSKRVEPQAKRGEDESLEVSLPSGRYRFRIASFNALGMKGATSAWTAFRILPAKKPAAAEWQRIIDEEEAERQQAEIKRQQAAERKRIAETRPVAEEDFEVRQNPDNTLTITKYTGTPINVDIPETLYGLKVTVIGAGSFSFRNNNSITSITIPDTVVEIGIEAFLYCKKLSKVNLGKGLVKIRDDAFRYCGLTSVVFPDSLTEIDKSC